jgi:DnaJ-domain-containing protein 1
MTDYFAALGQPRRPWLDAELLKQKFHTLSGAVHPDHVHDAEPASRQAAADRYAELNAAHQCLREPRTRLQHLIHLALGEKVPDSNQITDDMLRLFQEAGVLLRQADSLLLEKQSAAAPLLKVQLLEKALPCLHSINSLQSVLRERRDQLDSELRTLDAAWADTTRNAPVADELVRSAIRLCHQYGFINRWQAQLQDRAFNLTL